MENVHDHAHRLARVLRDSEEYQGYLRAQGAVEEDEKARELIARFRQKQWEYHSRQLAGEDLTEDDQRELVNLREILELKPDVRDFMHAEARFLQLVTDVQKILSEAIDLDLD